MASALSYFEVPVLCRPTFSILSTGDEIAEEEEELTFGKIRDINTYTLEAMIADLGGTVVSKRLLRDHKQGLSDAVREEAERSDFVLLSGGAVSARETIRPTRLKHCPEANSCSTG